jgi:hypothetical protein
LKIESIFTGCVGLHLCVFCDHNLGVAECFINELFEDSSDDEEVNMLYITVCTDGGSDEYEEEFSMFEN